MERPPNDSKVVDPPRVRVLHVITRLIAGGAQENTLLTVKHLNRATYDLTLASGYSTGPEGTLEDRIPKDVSFVRVPSLVRDPTLGDAAALASLFRLIRRGRYHIVHTHTTKAGILGRVAARMARVPILIHTPHGHAFHSYVGRSTSAALRLVEERLARWTHQIICLTPAERQDHINYRIGPPDLFEVIHSGVDIERFSSRQINTDAIHHKLGLPPGPLIGCVARLVSVKGVDVLLEALPHILLRVPDARVVFIGDGPMRRALEQRASVMKLNGHVLFLGLRHDVAEILPLFDVVAVPSRNEGMGRAVVEAMAAGRPVVGSRISGIQDVIKDGETGILVAPEDPRELAFAIVRSLTNPTFAKQMVQRAQAGLHSYDIASMIAKIDQVYQRWLNRKGY